MKVLKVFLIALVAMFTFASAEAQHVVVRLGGGYHHHYHHHYYRHHRWHRRY